MEEILNLLRDDARLSAVDIAAMTKKTPDEVAAIIKKLEKDGVILKYQTVINDEKLDKVLGKTDAQEKVEAVIEIQVSPEREHGFDSIAERIRSFPQVRSLYLMSGGYDLQVILSGDSLKEIAFFVARKLSPIEGVKSTKTHFVMNTYKEDGIIFEDEKKDSRLGVSA